MKLIIHLILRDFNSAPFYTNQPGMIATHVAGWDFSEFFFRIFPLMVDIHERTALKL